MPTRITVNGETIPEADLRAEIASLRTSLRISGQDLTFEQRVRLREEAIDAIVERTLLSEEARRLNLAGVGHLADYWGRKLKPASSGEIREYYRNHQDRFRRPEAVHASHFVKHSEGADPEQNRLLITQIRERVIGGEDFAALAVAFSDCPEHGGDLGFFPRGVMVEGFDEVVFSAPLLQPTPIFETCFGLHFAIVQERRPEGVLSLAEATRGIAEGLYRMKLDRELGIRLQALRKNARIEIL
jgi:parvulin-like peptidyl-prolyl isomerase